MRSPATAGPRPKLPNVNTEELGNLGLSQQIADLTARRDALRAMLNDWDHRLAKTPQNRPAHLLDALTVDAAGAVRQKGANLKRRR